MIGCLVSTFGDLVWIVQQLFQLWLFGWIIQQCRMLSLFQAP